MNAHAPIIAAVPDRMDEIVDLMKDSINLWYEVDNGNSYIEAATVVDRIEALATETSWLPCRSAKAAMLKLCAMEAAISLALADLKPYQSASAEALLQRQIGSVLRWIEAEFNMKSEDFRLDYYHTDRTERQSWCLELDGDTRIPA